MSFLPNISMQRAAWQPGLTAVPFVTSGHTSDLMLDTHVAAVMLTALLGRQGGRVSCTDVGLLSRAASGSPPAASSGHFLAMAGLMSSGPVLMSSGPDFAHVIDLVADQAGHRMRVAHPIAAREDVQDNLKGE